MAQAGDQRVTKADFAALLGWESLSDEAIHQAWDCYWPDGAVLAQEFDEVR
jgi:hypothetical protein